MKTKQQKMTDIQVVQLVLDIWDPLALTLLNTVGNSKYLGEYDTYTPSILELLKSGVSEEILREKLDDIMFNKMGSGDPDEFSAANHRYYAWILKQTWLNQRKDTSNIRLVLESENQSSDPALRVVSILEIVQNLLFAIDPKKIQKYWLYGADSINKYDNYALNICEIFLDEKDDKKNKVEKIAKVIKSAGLNEGALLSLDNMEKYILSAEKIVEILQVERVRRSTYV